MSRGKRRVRGPVEQFQQELDDLISRWAKKPEDDRLTYTEMVGSIELAKIELSSSCLEEGWEDEEEDEDWR